MAQTITTIIECPFYLSGSYAFTTNSGGTPVDVNGAGNSLWYRPALARSGATGTTAQPKSILNVVDTALGANWTVNPPSTTGYNSITWTGGGSNDINWGAGTGLIIRNLLGFSGNLSFTSGQTQTATYPAPYRLCLISRRDDTDWRPEAVGSAFTEAEDGSVYGFSSGRVLQRRILTLAHHPRTAADVSTAPVLSGFLATPMFPNFTGSSVSQITAPVEGLPTAVPTLPWTVLQHWHASRGRLLAAAFGTYQQILTGAVTTFDECYLDAPTCNRGPNFQLRDKRLNMICEAQTWGFNLFTAGVS